MTHLQYNSISQKYLKHYSKFLKIVYLAIRQNIAKQHSFQTINLRKYLTILQKKEEEEEISFNFVQISKNDLIKFIHLHINFELMVLLFIYRVFIHIKHMNFIDWKDFMFQFTVSQLVPGVKGVRTWKFRGMCSFYRYWVKLRGGVLGIMKFSKNYLIKDIFAI